MTKRLFAVATLAGGWLAVAGAVNPAAAVLSSGQFSMTGTDFYDLTANTLGIFNPALVNTGTGSFAGLVGTNITFTQCTSGTPCNYTALTGPLYTGALGLAYTINGLAIPTEGGADPTNLSIFANGTLTFAGFDPTPATFSFTSQGSGNGQTVTTFSATTVAVPGPVVGAGLPALLAACGGLIAFARRRRQQTA